MTDEMMKPVEPEKEVVQRRDAFIEAFEALCREYGVSIGMVDVDLKTGQEWRATTARVMWVDPTMPNTEKGARMRGWQFSPLRLPKSGKVQLPHALDREPIDMTPTEQEMREATGEVGYGRASEGWTAL